MCETSNQFQCKIEAAIVGVMVLIPGLTILGGMADGDVRYLPSWAPMLAGWGVGAFLTVAGAYTLWSAFRTK